MLYSCFLPGDVLCVVCEIVDPSPAASRKCVYVGEREGGALPEETSSEGRDGGGS